MSFVDRRWRGFEDMPTKLINSNDWLEGTHESQLVSNVVANYRQGLQVVGGATGYGPDDGGTWGVDYDCTKYKGGDLLTLPLTEIVTGTGLLRVSIYATLGTATAYAYLIVNAGRYVDKVYFENTTSDQWVTATLPIETVKHPLLVNDLVLGVRIGVDQDFGTGTNTINVRTISAYEVPDTIIGPYYQDTTDSKNKLGAASYAMSAAMSRLFAQNTQVIRDQRVPRGHIWQHVTKEHEETPPPSSYPAGDDNGGRWKVVVGSGVLDIDGVVAMSFLANANVKVGIYAINSIGYTAESAPFTVGMLLIGQTSGALATVTDVTDLGTTGTLGLGEILGTFAHAETIIGKRPYGGANGQATSNTGTSGPVLIDSDIVTTFGTGPSKNKPIHLDLDGADRQWAEYEIRLAYESATSASSFLLSLELNETLVTSIDYDIPNPLDTETQDDALASTYQKAKATNEHIWGNSNRTILHQCYKQWSTPYLKTYYQSTAFAADEPNTAREGIGPLNGIGNNLLAKIWFSRLPKTFKRLDITGSSGTIGEGDTVTGNTTGATAIVTMKRGTTSISIDNINGAFKAAEGLTFVGSGGGTATANGTQYEYQATQTLRFGVFKPDEWLVYRDVDLSQHERNKENYLEIELVMPDSILNDITVYTSGLGNPYNIPISWVIETISDDASDPVITNKYLVLERIQAPGKWNMTLEDDD